MKTCAYIFTIFALAGIVLAQSRSPYEIISADSNLVVRSEQNPYSPTAAATEESADEATLTEKIELIEKQITILTNYYNKMRISLQKIAHKMPQTQVQNASSEDGKEVLLVLNAMTDRMSNVESTIAKLSNQMEDLLKQASEPKTIAATSPQANDSEAIILGKEILMVVNAMSKKMNKIEMAVARANEASSQQAVLEKIANLEAAVVQLAQNENSRAPQRDFSQQPVIEKISSMESAIMQLSQQVSSLASQEKSAPSGSYESQDSSVANQEMMILFKAMHEKLGRIEDALTSGFQGVASPVSEDILVSIVGAVVSPGKIKVDATGKKDLLAALSEVGGFASNADRTAITVRRGPKVFTIDVDRIMRENLLSFMLEGKDIVVVKERENKKNHRSSDSSPQPAQKSSSLPALPPPSAASPSLQPSSQDKIKEFESAIEIQPRKSESSSTHQLTPQAGDIFPRKGFDDEISMVE